MQGNVFEKRLVEAYVSENGKDPITNEELSLDDLIELKTARTVKPRPPTLTSIPSLLSVFQNEWDALALETFTLRQHLTQTRQELSHSLYEVDAAKRVIARLSREKDDARDALSKIGLNLAATNGEAMQLDGQELNPTLVAKVDATQEKYDLSPFYLQGLKLNELPLGYPKLEGSAPYQRTGQLRRLSRLFRPRKYLSRCFQGFGISS